MAGIYVCGEALIDFMPIERADGQMAFIAKEGGSPFNIAKAAARAGGKAALVSAVSNTFFGTMLLQDLKASGVDTQHVDIMDKLTTLAFVDFSNGGPEYAFHNAGTCITNLQPDLSHIKPEPGSLLNFGSVSLVDNPGADAIVAFAQKECARFMISCDPNARPSVVTDPEDQRNWSQRIEQILDVTTILKLSTEDLSFMAPDVSHETFFQTQFDRGIRLIILTDGEHGAQARTKHAAANIPTPKIQLVDTVGAGDTLMGSALTWITDQNILEPSQIDALSENQLADMLRFSTIAASINCERQGCNPPWRTEIEDALSY